MGDHGQGHALVCQFFHDLQNLADHLGVQSGGRLVKEDHLRILHQGAGDGHTLLLAAGVLGGIGVLLVLQPHAAQQVDGFCSVAAGSALWTFRGPRVRFSSTVM